MVLLKYNKNMESVYLPHLDTLRAVTRTLKRAKIDVKYSVGFNPHMLIFFAPPLPIGLASECEYVAIECDGDAETVRRKYNEVCLKGLYSEKAFNVARNPNIAAISKQADIEVKLSGISEYFDRINEFTSAKEVVISYSKQGEIMTDDVKSRIFGVTLLDKDTLSLRLGCGHNNLRAERLIDFLAAKWMFDAKGAKYIRKKLYCDTAAGMTDIDTALENNNYK